MSFSSDSRCSLISLQRSAHNCRCTIRKFQRELHAHTQLLNLLGAAVLHAVINLQMLQHNLSSKARHKANGATDGYLAADSVKCMEDLRFTSWMAHTPPVPACDVGCMSSSSLLDMKGSTTECPWTSVQDKEPLHRLGRRRNPKRQERT